MNPERVAAERILTEVFRWELRNSPGTASSMERIIRDAYAGAPKPTMKELGDWLTNHGVNGCLSDCGRVDS